MPLNCGSSYTVRDSVNALLYQVSCKSTLCHLNNSSLESIPLLQPQPSLQLLSLPEVLTFILSLLVRRDGRPLRKINIQPGGIYYMMEHLTPSPRTSLDTALAEVKVNPYFHEGIRLTEVNTSGKTKTRYLTLSNDRFQIFITSSRLKKGKITSSLLKENKPLMQRIRNISTSSSSNSENNVNRTNESSSNDTGGKVIDICTIDRIQKGQNSMKFEYYRQEMLHHRNPNRSPKASAALSSQTLDDELIRSFSIIWRGERSLSLIAYSKKDRDIIIETLKRLKKEYERAKVFAAKDVLLLRYIWIDVDKDQSNFINESELSAVLNRINFYRKKSELENDYRQFLRKNGLDRKIRKRGFTFSQCVTFFHMIKRNTWAVKPYIRIWNDLFGEHRSTGERRVKVSAEMFLKKFLHAKQRQYDATMDTVRDIFLRLNHLETADLASNISGGEDIFIDQSRFEEYLNSRENDVFDPQKEAFNPMTMREPLSHYWINSSHNTYLQGDQIQSSSSVEMYLMALYRGCRCVEMDIYDGPLDPKPVPIVTHGHTLTGQITFTDIIDAISVFLMYNPDTYPLILSFENHCSKPYQEVMAEELIRVFGKRLFIPTEEDLFEELPSPESLKGMVIIKGHRCDVTEDDYEYSEADTEEGDDTQSLRTEVTKPKARTKICPALSRLTFFHGSAFKDLAQSKKNPSFQMHSFNDKRVVKLCTKNRRDWILYNQTNMSRSYPVFISRFLSGNYNPIIGWSAGIQLVALNFQTSDYELRLNDGRFRTNGNCGYVLKPQNMLQDRYIESFSEPISLEVQILSASRLPKPKGQKRGECIDPYVEVTLWDVNPQDGKEIKKVAYTNTVRNNGFYPIFSSDNSSFQFSVQSQHIAMLQFTVWDSDHGKNDDFIGSAAVPISCLRNGFRSVRLFDMNNTVSGAFDFANLLVEIKVERTLEEI